MLPLWLKGTKSQSFCNWQKNTYYGRLTRLFCHRLKEYVWKREREKKQIQRKNISISFTIVYSCDLTFGCLFASAVTIWTYESSEYIMLDKTHFYNCHNQKQICNILKTTLYIMKRFVVSSCTTVTICNEFSSCQYLGERSTVGGCDLDSGLGLRFAATSGPTAHRGNWMTMQTYIIFLYSLLLPFTVQSIFLTLSNWIHLFLFRACVI